MNLMIVNQQGGNNTLLRDYRKGNWTLQETMVLIEAKKMDDERRMKRLGDMSERAKPAELRWKWVEDYCWKNGCLRSQNQCNDKWDNLMRDFKKVREYQNRVVVGHDHEEKSYWRIEKNERKDNHLPSNMLPQIYEALMDVMERKSGRGVVVIGGSTSGNVESDVGDKSAIGGGGGGLLGHLSMPMPVFGQQQQQQQQRQNTIVRSPPATVVLPISPPVETTPEAGNIPFTQQLPSVDSDTSEYSDSPAKRRKKGGEGGGSGEGTSGGGGVGGPNTLQEVGTAISKSAAIIAEALQSSEEREERRHREILSLHERRLQIEESKAEINRQGINGLVDAVNKLANSILALAGNNNQTASK